MRFHVSPASVLLKIPAPIIASILNHPSPVPAYITAGFVLSWIITVTARFSILTSTGTQEGLAARKLVVRKMPPLTEEASTVFPLASLLSTRTHLVRPPIL